MVDTPPPPSRVPKWLIALAVAAAFVGAYFAGLLDSSFWLGLLQKRDELRALADAHPVGAKVLFFVAVVVALGLSFPAAWVFTILAGVLFGLWWGLLIISFGSTAGAVLAFLAGRTLFADVARRALPQRWRELVDRGVERDGWKFLLFLRLSPLVPFFAVNLLMGLTRLPLRTFWVVSQLGMLPMSFAYVSAGAAAREVRTLSDVASPSVVAALALLGLLPLLVGWLTRRRKREG